MADLILGDEHSVFLDALSITLRQNGHEVLGAAQSGPQVVELVRAHQPDICLIDRRLIAVGGAPLIGSLRQACPGIRVVILSSDHDPDEVRRALNAGAHGYVHKSRGVASLMLAIKLVLDGQVAVQAADSCVRATSPASGMDEGHKAARRLAAHLTPRERQCLQMLADGLSTAAIMAELGVSRTTVRTHVQAVLFKLGVHSRLQAVSLAVRYGLLIDDIAQSAARGRNGSGLRASAQSASAGILVR